MDFVALPPEVNSARIETGPGAGSLVAAGTAWNAIASELHWMAADYSAAINGMAVWQGPSSVAMIISATRFIQWIHEAAAFSEQTATQAQQAISAYVQARTSMVPLSAVTANRTLLSTLVATNIFGQNFPAIAATEVQYMQMWAQDAAAMIGYSDASSAAAAALPTLPLLSNFLNPTSSISTFQAFVSSGTYVTLPISLLTLLVANEAVRQQEFAAQAIVPVIPAIIPAVTPGLAPSIIAPAAENAELTASMGTAGRLGSWSVPAQAVRLVAQGGVARPLAEISDMPTIIPPPLMSMGSKALGDKGSSNKPKTGREIPGTVMPRPPVGG